MTYRQVTVADLSSATFPLQTLGGTMTVPPIRPPDAAETEPLRQRASGQFVPVRNWCAFCPREARCREAVDRYDGTY
ncbi:MAG TPA: hypothetical protein VM223_13815, partial [Planctomycetota bacterium]|nr:hypothetical protein [Planctomycetota bacterium]